MSASFEDAASHVPIYRDTNIDGHDFKIMVNYISVLPIIEELGEGSNSKVWRVFDHRDKMDKAMKVVTVTPRTLKGFLAEVEILKRATQEIEGIPKYYEHFVVGGSKHLIEMAIIMQFVDGYDLEKDLEFEPEVDDVTLFRFSYWLFDTVSKLHALNITHNDIKPSNIIIDKNDHFYLVDFGFACYTQVSDDNVAACPLQRRGSYTYMSPEAITAATTKQYNLKANDVWACGMVLFEMINMGHLYGGDSLNVLVKMISGPIKVPDRKPISNLVSMCLSPQPSRCTAQQALDYLKARV